MDQSTILSHLLTDCPSPEDDKRHCKNVWLLEYDLNENQDDWNAFEKSAANVVLGKTPQLSIVAFGREFDIEEKGPRSRVYASDETRPKPVKQVFLGETQLDHSKFMEFYSKLIEANGHFGPGSYDFFNNNAVHFADALSVKLVEKKLPVQYQLVSEKTAMKVGAMAASACTSVGCFCTAAVSSFKDQFHKKASVEILSK